MQIMGKKTKRRVVNEDPNCNIIFMNFYNATLIEIYQMCARSDDKRNNNELQLKSYN